MRQSSLYLETASRAGFASSVGDPRLSIPANARRCGQPPSGSGYPVRVFASGIPSRVQVPMGNRTTPGGPVGCRALSRYCSVPGKPLLLFCCCSSCLLLVLPLVWLLSDPRFLCVFGVLDPLPGRFGWSGLFAGRPCRHSPRPGPLSVSAESRNLLVCNCSVSQSACYSSRPSSPLLLHWVSPPGPVAPRSPSVALFADQGGDCRARFMPHLGRIAARLFVPENDVTPAESAEPK